MNINGLKTMIHLKEPPLAADSSLSQAKTSKTNSSICVEKAINMAGAWWCEMNWLILDIIAASAQKMPLKCLVRGGVG